MLYVFYCYYILLSCKAWGSHTPLPTSCRFWVSLLSRPELSPVTPRPVSSVCCTGPWLRTRAVVTSSTRQSRQRCAMVSTWSENIRCSVNVTARHYTTDHQENSPWPVKQTFMESQILTKCLTVKCWEVGSITLIPTLRYLLRDISFELVDSFDKEPKKPLVVGNSCLLAGLMK